MKNLQVKWTLESMPHVSLIKSWLSLNTRKKWIHVISYMNLPDCDSDLCRPDPSDTSESLLQICVYTCIYKNQPQ